MSFQTQLAEFLVRHPERADVAALFGRFLGSHAEVFERHHPPGHFTASCWLVSADGERILLTHHRKLGRWLQLGGHADGDTDLARVALREAEEESGLTGLTVEAAVFDLDRHTIPARGTEPEHWHYDVRFVVFAGANEDFVVSDESHALAWRRIADMPGDASLDDSMQRMATYWLQRHAIPSSMPSHTAVLGKSALARHPGERRDPATLLGIASRGGSKENQEEALDPGVRRDDSL